MPTANKDKHRDHAEPTIAVFKDHGAPELVECWGDDMPEGEVDPMLAAVLGKPDEAVVFGRIVWPDKATRDVGVKKVMDDPRMHPDNNPVPFDGRRMIFGGYNVIGKG